MSEIERKYSELGRENGILSNAITVEIQDVDNVGRYRYFINGAIYWHPDVGVHVVGSGQIRQEWNRRTFSTAGQAEIHLLATNGQYIVAEGGGGGVINANRDIAQAWEIFTLIRTRGSGPLANKDTVQIRSSTGQYLKAGGGIVRADGSGNERETVFQIINRNGSDEIFVGDPIALRTNDGKYLVAENGGGGIVNANQDQVTSAASFDIVFMGGGQQSLLGYPTEDVLEPAAREAAFQNGQLAFANQRGYVLHEKILKKWQALADEGRAIGMPTADSQLISGRDGVMATFEHGHIYWTPTTGAHDLRGKILERWQEMEEDQAEFAKLQYPITDQQKKVNAQGQIFFNHFEWGSIYWPEGAATAVEIYGEFRRKWSSLSQSGSAFAFLRSSLGYFVSVELSTSRNVVVDRKKAGPWETFVLQRGNKTPAPLRDGDIIQIQTSNGSTLQAVNGGGGAIEAVQTPTQGWANFEITRLTGSNVDDEVRFGNRIALKTNNGHYLLAEQGGGGRLTAASSSIGMWETFTVEFIGGQNPQLGYPTKPQETNVDGTQTVHFEQGNLILEDVQNASDLTFFQQNMALLPATWNGGMNEDYQGTDRGEAVKTLIKYVQDTQPDIVGLSECFEDDERETIENALTSDYQYSLVGPQEGPLLDRNSGLLLLSKHKIETSHQTLYRHYPAGTRWVNRGVLHARIKVSGHPTAYDIFLTQAQTPDQLAHLSSFIRAYSSPGRPAMLMGDLNIDAYDSRLNGGGQMGEARAIMAQLQPDRILWQSSSNGFKDITANDPASTFGTDTPRPPNDPTRRQAGTRPDYFLLWPGDQFAPGYTNTEVVVLQTAGQRDISDHYGLKTTQSFLYRWSLEDVTRTVNKVIISLAELHCLTKTPGGMPDQLMLELTVNGIPSDPQPVERLFERDGQRYPLDNLSFPIDNPTALEITVTGRVKNRFADAEPGTVFSGLPDQPLGEAKLHLTHAELLQLPAHPVRRVLPLLVSDRFLAEPGAEYAVTVEIETE